MPTLYSCGTPTDQTPRSNYLNFQSQLLFLNTTGAAVASPSPALARSPAASGTFLFQYPAAVFSLVFTTSILNPVAGLVAVHLVGNQGEATFSASGSVTSFAHHLTLQNSSTTSFGPSNRTTVLPFGSIDAINFYGGQSISFYISAPNDASVQIACAATIFYSLVT